MIVNSETVSYSQVPVVKDVVASVKEENEAWVYTFPESFENCAMTSTGSQITHDMSRDQKKQIYIKLSGGHPVPLEKFVFIDLRSQISVEHKELPLFSA